MRRVVAPMCMAGLLLAGCVGGPSPSVSPTDPSPSEGMGSPGTGEAGDSADPGETLRYVALGDSYTIGTSVRPRERWPNQLVRALRPDVSVDLAANLGTNGATSRDVIDQQLPQLESLRPQLVTVLIGVNDVVQRVDPGVYRANVSIILDALLARVTRERILVITTPDYTLTPHGGDYGDRAEQSAGIDAVNAVIVDEAQRRDLTVVDITPVSDRVPEDPSLLARDRLHPSAKQYAGWVELIALALREQLRTS